MPHRPEIWIEMKCVWQDANSWSMMAYIMLFFQRQYGFEIFQIKESKRQELFFLSSYSHYELCMRKYLCEPQYKDPRVTSHVNCSHMEQFSQYLPDARNM